MATASVYEWLQGETVVADYKNPPQLDVVDRCLRRMGDKTIPDEAPPSLESFLSPMSRRYRSTTNTWTSASRRLSHRCRPNKEVALNCLIAWVVMVTPWRLFAMQINACHPLQLKPYGYVPNIKHISTFVDLRYLCVRDSLLCVFICT